MEHEWSDLASYLYPDRRRMPQSPIETQGLDTWRAGRPIPRDVTCGTAQDMPESWYLLDLQGLLASARQGRWRAAWMAVGGHADETPDLNLERLQCIGCIAERYIAARLQVEAQWDGRSCEEREARWRVYVRRRPTSS